MVTFHSSSGLIELYHPDDRQLASSNVLDVDLSDSFDDSFLHEDAVSDDTSANSSDSHHQRLRETGIDLSDDEIQKITNTKKHVPMNNGKNTIQVETGYIASRKVSALVLSLKPSHQSGLRKNNMNSKGDCTWFTLSASNIHELSSIAKQNKVSKLTVNEIEAREKEAILASKLPAQLPNRSGCNDRIENNEDKKHASPADILAQTGVKYAKYFQRSDVQQITQTEKEARVREKALIRKLESSQQKVDGSKTSISKDFMDRQDTTRPTTKGEIPSSNELNTRSTEGSTISSISTIEAEARRMAENLERKLQSMIHRNINVNNPKTNLIANNDSQKETKIRGANDDATIPEGRSKILIPSVRDDSESRKQHPEAKDRARTRNQHEEGDLNYSEDRRDEALPREIVVYGENSTMSSRSDHKLGPKQVKTSFRKDIESQKSIKWHGDERFGRRTENCFERDVLQRDSFPDAVPLAREQKFISKDNRNEPKSSGCNKEESRPSKKSAFRREGSARGKRVTFAPMETLNVEGGVRNNRHHRDGMAASDSGSSTRTRRSKKPAWLAQRHQWTMNRTMIIVSIILFVAFSMIMFVVLDPLRKMTRH